MKQPATGRSDSSQDGLARQLMAKRQDITGGSQQAAGDALVDFVEDRTGDGEQEIGIDRRADDRRNVDDGPRFTRETGRASEDRVPNGGRGRSLLGAEHLGEEERVASGQPVQGADVAPAARGESLTLSSDRGRTLRRWTVGAVARSPSTRRKG